MNNLLKRSLTGLLYVIFIVVTVVTNEWTLLLLMATLAALGVLEFERLKAIPVRSRVVKLIDLLGALLMVCVSFMSALSLGDMLMLYLVYVIVRLVVELFRADKLPITSLGHSFLGQVYVVLPLALMPKVYLAGGAPLLLGMFVMIWLNDTGAFCVGSLFGRHRLFERISPKKSWEGFFGGLLFTIGAAFVYKYCFGAAFHQSIGWLVGMGLLVGVAGTLGDLIESMMKRAIHVKDSGHLLPGHGGILDRIDSLLLVLPALTLYTLLL